MVMITVIIIIVRRTTFAVPRTIPTVHCTVYHARLQLPGIHLYTIYNVYNILVCKSCKYIPCVVQYTSYITYRLIRCIVNNNTAYSVRRVTVHHTVYNVQYTVYYVQYTVYYVQYTVYYIHCTSYSIQCTSARCRLALFMPLISTGYCFVSLRNYYGFLAR